MRSACRTVPARRAVAAQRLAWRALAGLLAVAGVSLLSGEARGAVPGGSPQAMTAPAPALGLEALQAQAGRQQDELKRLEGELQAAQRTHAEGEREAAQRAHQIEQLKNEPPGVTHDLELQELLARAQAQAFVLSQQASDLRAREAGLRSVREQLVLTCDQILAADTGGKLPMAQRLLWLRLRTTQVEAMHGAEGRAAGDQAVRTVVQAGAALQPGSGAEAAGIDDPQVLRERADLLRDSADKLRREMQRLKTRSDEMSRRQRLRERAARVDEDLFAEQTTSRHTISRSGGNADNAAAPQAYMNMPSVQGPAPGPSPGGTQTDPPPSFRNSVDPSTLDVLQRVESLTGSVANPQSLQRAQAELAAMADQLLSRASRLERRADELAHKK